MATKGALKNKGFKNFEFTHILLKIRNLRKTVIGNVAIATEESLCFLKPTFNPSILDYFIISLFLPPLLTKNSFNDVKNS